MGGLLRTYRSDSNLLGNVVANIYIDVVELNTPFVVGHPLEDGVNNTTSAGPGSGEEKDVDLAIVALERDKSVNSQ